MLTRQQFDQEISGLEPQLKAMGLTVDDARRQFFRKTIGPTLKGKPNAEKAKALEEWGLVTKPDGISQGEDAAAAILSGVASSLPAQVGFAITNPVRRILGQEAVNPKDLAYEPQTTTGKIAGLAANVGMEALIPGGAAVKGAKGGLSIAKTALAAGKSGLATGAARSVLESVNQGQAPKPLDVAKQAVLEGGLSALGGAALSKASNAIGKQAPTIKKIAHDIRSSQAGMALPLDNSPTLKVLEGGVKHLAADGPTPQPHPVSNVVPEAIQALGPEAKNLKGQAAKVVSEAAGELPRQVATLDDVAAVDPHDFLRLDKFDISEEERSNLAKLVQQSVAETGGNPKPRITFDQIKQEAAEIDPSFISQLKPPKAGETINPAVRQAARDRLNALNSEAVKVRTSLEQNRNRLSPDEVTQQEALADRLERDAKGLIDVLYPTRSQDGRNLAYHRMMASNTFDADYWMSRARRANGGALDNDRYAAISKAIADGDTAMKAGDEPGVRQARMALAKQLMALERSSKLEVLTALRKAGLLTGIKTHLKNVAGNTGFQVMEEVSRIPASVVDIALSLRTGERTVSGASGAALGRSSFEAATKGFREAAQMMRHGATDDQLSRLDLGRQVNSGNKLLDGYVNGVFRLLGAEDRIFKSYAIRRSLEDQARVMALNAKDKTLAKKFVGDALSGKNDAMMAKAIADAEFATFNNDNVLASAIERGKSVRPVVRTAADLVVPFVKTPTNVIARVLEYSGAHAVAKSPKAIAKLINKSLTTEEQRSFAQSIGRGVVGLPGIILLGYKLAESGHMTGTYQSDPKDKGLNEAANRPAGAIKVGDTWHQVGGLSPWGNLLVLGATMYRDAKESPDALTAAGTVGSVAVKTALDQPFLQGLEGVTDVAKDPGKELPRFVGDMAGSFVPTIVSDVGTATDTKQREAEGIAQGIQRRLPGLRNQLPAKVDALGHEVANDPINAINPLMSRTAKEELDPAIGEIVRLGVGLTKPDDTAKVKGKRTNLTNDQHRELTELAGERIKAKLDKLVNSKRYESLDDDKRRDLIEKVIQNERSRARAAFTRTLSTK